MEKRTRGILNLLLRFLVTAVLLGVVVSRVDVEDFWNAVFQVRLRFLLMVFALSVFGFLVRSYRFHLILKILDCSVSTLKVFAVSSVTMLYSLALPGLVSTGVKWYLLKEQTGKASNILSCMAYNQTSEMTVKVLIGLFALAWANPGSGIYVPLICGTVALLIVMLCVFLLNGFTGPKINRAFKVMFRLFPRYIRKNAEKILGQVEAFQTAGWRFHAKMGCICLFVGFIGIFLYICAAKAAGISVPAIALAWQCSVVFVLGKLPISIANIGPREMALTEFLAAYGVSESGAFLMSMVIFSSVLFMAAIGAVYQVTWMFLGRKTSKVS